MRVLIQIMLSKCPKVNKPDPYTKEILIQSFLSFKAFYMERVALKRSGISIRLPILPEDISENMVKFRMNAMGKSFRWSKCKNVSGDLVSDTEGKQEVKCFTSNGPISFGPKESWDIIYFLDAREWTLDRFTMWRIQLKNDSDEWKKIQMNKMQTYDDQCKQGRRPRLHWDALYQQMKPHAEQVFYGSFMELF
jgi:hypothetical protein